MRNTEFAAINMLKRNVGVFILSFSLSSGLMAAQELNGPQETSSSVESGEHIQETPKKKTRGKVRREKEAEGTKAPNRFDADTINKSQYKLNGSPLEVDTD